MMAWLPWILCGVSVAFGIYACYRAGQIELEHEQSEEYFNSVSEYRKTVVNEVLTYLQVWFAWDEKPDLAVNTFADVSQVVLTRENTRVELNVDWSKQKMRLVLNYYEYTNEEQISAEKDFKFRGFLVPKLKLFNFVQKFKNKIENADGKETLTNVIESARQVVAEPTDAQGKEFGDEDFRGLLYEASIMLGDEIAAGKTTLNTQKSLFMIMSYIFHTHQDEYLKYVAKDIEKEEESN